MHKKKKICLQRSLLHKDLLQHLRHTPQTRPQPIQVSVDLGLVKYQLLHNNFPLEFEAVH